MHCKMIRKTLRDWYVRLASETRSVLVFTLGHISGCEHPHKISALWAIIGARRGSV